MRGGRGETGREREKRNEEGKEKGGKRWKIIDGDANIL
uniref:Uncharacterized protein n=1 Tax=Anguilla anguilla TaxID=7936 RepID=A0A0E9W2V6_ANGAN